jgi:hypothetical protein
LKIGQNLIQRVECWANVVFVHRLDRGGQFVSYRKLVEWHNAIAHHIQSCPKISELAQLATSIHRDSRKFNKQYCQQTIDFLLQMCRNRQEEFNIWEAENCLAC